MRACLAWLDRYRRHPCLVFARLSPGTAEQSVQDLLRFLRTAGILDQSLVAVVPEVAAGGESFGLFHLPTDVAVPASSTGPLDLPQLREHLLRHAGLAPPPPDDEEDEPAEFWKWSGGSLPQRVSALWHDREELR